MTKGLAILCMLILHLFCRTGSNVFGTPLLWINDTIPLVYVFGFFAEICVPLYSLCAGYARQLMFEKSKVKFKNNVNRVLKLMVNYWIILVLFCVLGLLFDTEHKIPGSLFNFLKSIVLLHSYNGAWWYLNTYVLLLLLPYDILFLPIKKLKIKSGLIFCLIASVFMYFVGKFNLVELIPFNNEVLSFLIKEIYNLTRILPSVWAGAFLCKGRVFEKIQNLLKKYISERFYNIILLLAFSGLFLITVIVNKAIFFDLVGLVVFIIFNLLNKSKFTKNVFMFLGKHSTNIWLTHMFFYSCLFKNLVQIVKYPIIMLLFMLLLCTVVSYVVIAINKIIDALILYFSKISKNKFKSF